MKRHGSTHFHTVRCRGAACPCYVEGYQESLEGLERLRVALAERDRAWAIYQARRTTGADLDGVPWLSFADLEHEVREAARALVA